MDQERYEELQRVKEDVKKKNVDAVAELLLDLRDKVHKAQDEMDKLRQLTTTTLQSQQDLQNQLNILKQNAYQGIGTGEIGN